ncbi:hypothetical protein P4639_22455 [Priestia megaterium]|uniref:hypothetical protein n=1 Tax=Priestia megaterium TaxID=1404 RepID=UPI002E1D7ED9|nr:hypothetical protein [Priestia megaterium]
MFEVSNNKVIDKAVQKFVLGWDYNPTFRPSTNFSHAMVVEQHLYTLGYEVLIRRCASEKCGLLRTGEARHGDFFCNVTKEINGLYKVIRHKSVAPTLPLAICCSALKSVGIDIEESLEERLL